MWKFNRNTFEQETQLFPRCVKSIRQSPINISPCFVLLSLQNFVRLGGNLELMENNAVKFLYKTDVSVIATNLIYLHGFSSDFRFFYILSQISFYFYSLDKVHHWQLDTFVLILLTIMITNGPIEREYLIGWDNFFGLWKRLTRQEK